MKPYSGLLLYHSPGTGKTCSSIGSAEALRRWYRQREKENMMATRIQRCWRKYWYTDLDEEGVNRFCKYSMKEMCKNDNK